MSKTISLMFAGVGGQGSLLIAELTSLAAVSAGHDTKQTEVHGVSQRGNVGLYQLSYSRSLAPIL